MTKNEWIREWRERRISNRHLRELLPTGNIGKLLRELYQYSYTIKQQSIIGLVERYKNKLSSEYIKNHEKLMEKWRPEAKARASEMFSNLIYKKNPFLSLIPKEDNFAGKYIPVPLKYS